MIGRFLNPPPLEPRGFPQATRTMVPWQVIAALFLVLMVLLGLLVNHYRTLLALNILVTVIYLVSAFYRTLLIDISLRQNREIDIGPRDLACPPDGGWPFYTVMVPLYRESGIFPHLIASLGQLDYPKDKLEILLLIEGDDEETKIAAAAMDLQAPFQICFIPPSLPRTKPKACNVALGQARGDYLVIYDAEDRPEIDQLKKAISAFQRVPPNVACIQAKLNFYNSDQNIMTRWFTAEYAMWFDLCLPGLDFFRAPIPLGGTSNHFRMGVLRQLKGWDEYNVTEDCDLGLRLFCGGWRTRILNSTTWEQACPDVRFWIPQRSRWVKGYIQTYFVHLRSPLKLCRGLGILNSLHFHLLIGSTSFCQLVNPIYWILTVIWLISHDTAFSAYFPGPVFVMAAVCLFVGNFLFAYTCSIACVRRGVGHLAKYGLAMPLYWALMSIGAWKGFLQLFFKPHYWEKTKHFAQVEPPVSAATASPGPQGIGTPHA